MLPAAEDMERGLAQFTAAVDAIETTAEGVVRITAPPGVADGFVAPLLARFHDRFPRVVVELDASVGYADLTRREADLALRSTRPRSGDLLAVRVVQTRSLPMTSPEYAASLGKLKTLERRALDHLGGRPHAHPDRALDRRAPRRCHPGPSHLALRAASSPRPRPGSA